MSGVTRKDWYEQLVSTRLGREHKRGSIHRCKYIEQVTSSRPSAPIEALADLVTQHGESSSFPFHVQKLNPPQASSRTSQAILDEGAAGNGQEA